MPATHLLVAQDEVRRCGADAVVVDLEDGVAPADKLRARDAVQQWSAAGGRGWVRVNAAPTIDWEADLELVTHCPGVVGVVLAKAESADQIRATAERLDPKVSIVALIESATGVLESASIARVPATTRLAFGSGDFRRDTHALDDSHTAMAARSQLVLASSSAGLPAPIDGPALDADILQAYCKRGAALGMAGMLCLHLDHVPVVNAEFTPSEDEVVRAHDVLADRGEELDGSYLPRRRHAQAVLDRARRFGVDPLARREQATN
ncbi:HpcH/HpaI aldolase/citrate lyase family protein [Rhodococcus sp. NPDC057529]|uniref:HpcH/HpaI aldolase/citrate lyase family protein n=1 Tax=Rhodococcus sp. NPDC057529 TaxID=3346158 RepID=UPI00366BFCFD